MTPEELTRLSANAVTPESEKFVSAPFTCVNFNIRKASRAVTQIYDEHFQAVGIRSTQYALMIAITFMGRHGIGTLAEALATERTTLSRNLKLLVKQGLVENAEGADRRTRCVQLTQKGREMIHAAHPIWEKAQKEVMAKIGETRFNVLKSVVDDVVEMASLRRGEESLDTWQHILPGA